MNMAADIKVSVIIPVYNAEKYLRECLDSVCNQSLQEIEIICVDDGSKDNSLTILREYVEQDERLKIIEQVNSGAGVARNTGMKAAVGEYLAFMDADDLYYPQALAQAYAVAVKEKADMVAFDAKYFNENAEWSEGQLNRLLLAGRPVVSAENDGKFLFQLASCNTWCKLYKHEFVQRKGLRYQEIKTANDLCFVCSALAVAARIAVQDKPLVKHRVLHSGNLQSVKVKTPLDFMAALEQLKNNLQRFGLWERLRQSYLNCALGHFVYNWQTLDKNGRKQIAAKSREITELLELAEHAADYYYNMNDYVLMCRVVGFHREGDLRIMGKLKNMLKHILPPPVNAFNREVAGIKQYMLELNSGLMAQQRLLQEQYAEQLEMLAKRQKEQLACIEERQRLLADEIQHNEEMLNKIVRHNNNIETKLTDLTNRQNELSDEVRWLFEEMGQSVADDLQKQNKALLKDIKAEINKPVKRDYAYYEDLFTNKYEKELKIWYKAKTGEELNLQNPKTFNEKIQWLKLYNSTPLKTRLADKYLVREWVAEKIGEQYLIPLLGVWDSFDEIDFARLPDRFVLKANHGYNWNIIVKDKAQFDREGAKAKFDEWLNTNFAFKGLEIHYMNIPPKIMAEEYLENDNNDLYNYKVFCFGGKAESIMYLSGRKQGLKMAFFDLDWHKLPFVYSYPMNEADIPKPKNLDLLIELAEKLAEGFPHVRVDFYILNDGSLKFGEMTFTTANGTCKWEPPEQNRIYGDLIKLPPKIQIPERI